MLGIIVGFYKTLKLIKLHFYWPHMERHVKAFIARCMFCLTYKPKLVVPSRLKLPIGVPFEVLAMDLYVASDFTWARIHLCAH